MLKIISGTFENGNGIIIHDTDTDNYYHKVVVKNSIEHNGKLYYKDDFETMKSINEWYGIIKDYASDNHKSILTALNEIFQSEEEMTEKQFDELEMIFQKEII